MNDIPLIGLDGSNLLAFLAALGTLRTLTLAEGGIGTRMKWVRNRGWFPVIMRSGADTDDDLLAILESAVCGEKSISDAWRIGEDLTLALENFREVLLKCMAVCTADQRTNADFLAAFGSDGIGSGPKKDRMSTSDLRALGGGQQSFLGSINELATVTGRNHIRLSLFCRWEYSDSRPSMRWDPADYRPHALRANDPAGDPIKTMR